ncbi:MAG TPA: glutamine-hydrolyzing GMP synthase [Clostridiaceae bacterium]|nr:glutamine-hydrolyzing GMP synthase [Clostridiaceae bacterium]
MFLKETILILDFGGSHSQLLARKIRKNNVYCEILPYNAAISRIRSLNPKGIVLTGNIVGSNLNEMSLCTEEIFKLSCPVLGINYGALVLTKMLGGSISALNQTEECAKVLTSLEKKSILFKSIETENYSWLNQTVDIEKVPKGYNITGKTKEGKTCAFENEEKNIYGLLFHPEVSETVSGNEILRAFLYDVCKVSGTWNMKTYVEETIEDLKEKFQDSKVLLGLSGGVDSAVCAALVGKAIGRNLTCIFVDHGFMRKNEGEQIKEVFTKQFDINLVCVDARQRFLEKLAGVTDPEAKRKIIGKEFIEVFQEEARKVGAMDFFVQGTIYPDVIESGVGNIKVVKSHHNVGGLPEDIQFGELVEPLRSLFKDEVRQCGLELGLPKDIVMRQPFPGPGLAIRVIGEVTEEKLEIVREADHIFRDEIAKAGLDTELNQYFTVLTNMRSVGVRNNSRTYDYTIALRAVITTDFMTAKWARIPYEILEKVSERIINEVEHVNRVVYDITGKPPATIEWE